MLLVGHVAGDGARVMRLHGPRRSGQASARGFRRLGAGPGTRLLRLHCLSFHDKTSAKPFPIRVSAGLRGTQAFERNLRFVRCLYR